MATPPPPYGSAPHAWAPPPGGQAHHQAPYPNGPYAPPQPPPGYAVPQPYGPYPPQPGTPACGVCGAGPAAPAVVRGHQGIIVLMRFLSRRGTFCRDCGLATVREMSARTLWQGWWGPMSLFITPVTLLMNLGPAARFRGLTAPTGGFRPALDPGKPLLRRPEALLFLVPMLLVALALPALFVIGLLSDGARSSSGPGFDTAPTLAVGACVRNDGDWHEQDLQVTECGAPDAQYRVTRRLERAGTSCARGELYADLRYGPGGTTVSCLEPLR
ncbi:LppU/SCO3897 family protein [Streptomyces lunalinharesii]|uniref:Toxin-antitoxin system, toxin component n=1 Tax=Streptomyces lunalinharesii TaxID=333384 RepID=A0ABP6ESY7_9ACTN